MSEAIVRGALLRIAQHAVGFGRFLELLFRLVVAGIAIRVKLQRELAIRRLQRLIVASRTTPSTS